MNLSNLRKIEKIRKLEESKKMNLSQMEKIKMENKKMSLSEINELEKAYKSSKDLEAFKNDLKMYYDDIVEHKIAAKAYFSDEVIYRYGDYANALRENLVCAYHLTSFDELRPIYKQFVLDLDSKFEAQSANKYWEYDQFIRYIHHGDLYEDVYEENPEIIEHIRENEAFDKFSGGYIYMYEWNLFQKKAYLNEFRDCYLEEDEEDSEYMQ
jgi:hypothetical protein